MKYLLTLITFLMTLHATSTPKVYAALGDVIYNDDAKIEKLLQLRSMQKYETKIKKYLEATAVAKEVGFSIEKGDTSLSKKEYLHTLRQLSKEHDYFIRDINSAFSKSIDMVDLETFTFLSQCSMVDLSNERERTLEFYNVYKEDINSSAVDLVMFNQEMIIKNSQVKKVVKLDVNQTQTRPANNKVKRIREKDKAKKKAKEDAIEKESKIRKDAVQAKQKEELGIK